MPCRPLALISALTAGDLLLWNWSLGANQTVVALIAGLTLPPIAAAFLLMLGLTAARLVARIRPPAIRAVPRRRTATAQSQRARTAFASTRRPRPGMTPTSAAPRARHTRTERDERELAATTAAARPRRQDRKLAA